MDKPMTTAPTLPSTLAQRVQVLREKRGITRARLAESAQVPESLIEDIEEGLTLFLAPAVRQKLARALKIKPSTLQQVEKTVDAPKPLLSAEGVAHLLSEIEAFPDTQHDCPACGKPLVVRIFDRRDLEDRPIIELKIHCSGCLFKA